METIEYYGWNRKLIQELSMAYHVDESVLCSGLCTETLLRKFLENKKELSGTVRTYLLGRLGDGAEDYVRLVDVEEYSEWYARMGIIAAIIEKRYEDAQEQLEVYRKEYWEGAPERQFYYAMRGTISGCLGEENDKTFQFWKSAKNETIKNVRCGELQAHMLCVQELNVLLDYYMTKENTGSEAFLEVMEYMQQERYNLRSKSKVFPKACYFYIQKRREERTLEDISLEDGKELLRWITESLDLLRDTHSIMYLYECLLEYRTILKLLLNQVNNEDSKKKLSDAENWIWAIEKMYEYADSDKETIESAIVYITNNVECVNDVIERRRKMLGIQRAELADRADVAVRTLERMKEKKSSPRRDNACRMMEALNLPPDYSVNDLIVTQERDADLVRKFRLAFLAHSYEKANVYLTVLEEYVDQSARYNKQMFCQWRSLLDFELKKTNCESYLDELKNNLSITVPWKALMSENKLELTKTEENIINAYILDASKDSEENQRILSAFAEYCKDMIKMPMAIGRAARLDMIVRTVGSAYGNRGDFEKSDEWNKLLMENSMKSRRMFSTAALIYEQWWNANEAQKASGGQAITDKSRMQCCALISNFGKRNQHEAFYSKKLALMGENESLTNRPITGSSESPVLPV